MHEQDIGNAASQSRPKGWIGLLLLGGSVLAIAYALGMFDGLLGRDRGGVITSEQQFDAAVNNARAGLVVMHFHSPGSEDSSRFQPVVDQARGRFSGQMTFYQVDLDKAPALAQRLGIQNAPALQVYRRGSLVCTQRGYIDYPAVERMLTAMASQPTRLRPG